jgi:U3 small nucleolar RNA-associated protein 13
MTLSRQLVGNHDEVTDLCFVGPAAAPTHLLVATNSPQVRMPGPLSQ